MIPNFIRSAEYLQVSGDKNMEWEYSPMVLSHVEESCVEVREPLMASGDYQNLKRKLDLLKKERQNLTIRFLQAPFVSSMVLGLIVRLALLENLELTIECDTRESFRFFETMGLEKNIRLLLLEDFVDSKHLS